MEAIADIHELEELWNALKRDEPHVRIREAAARLGVAEATLLSLLLGRSVKRLRCEPAALMAKLEPLGTLMALTRNDGAVLECQGVYAGLNVQGNVGLQVGEIDLRIDFSHWAHAFAEQKDHAGRRLRSVQYFDRFGGAVHKLYLENESRAEEWDQLVAEFVHEDQEAPFADTAAPAQRAPKTGDAAALLAAWEGLSDPHHFLGMLRKSGFDRSSAFEAAQGRFTKRIEAGALMPALKAAANQVPLMFFVGNAGCLQIYTGPISNVKAFGTWVNVLDPTVNLHVDLSTIAGAWAVRKPSSDGTVHSLEFLDKEGDTVLQVFGKRKPGEPELEAWTNLVAGI